MDTPPFRPVIRNQAALEETWRQLMGPGGFAGPALWLMLVGADDRPVPQLIEITDADEPPPLEEVPRISVGQRPFVAIGGPDARLACLRSRPGSPTLTHGDREWARTAYALADALGIRCEPVHLATAGQVRVISPDDLISGIGA